MTRGVAPSPVLLTARRRSVASLCAFGISIVLVLALLGLAGFVFLLHRSENSSFLREQFLNTLMTGLGPDHKVAVERAQLQLSGVAPVFTIEGLEVSRPSNGATARLERAEFALPYASLWRLNPQARAVRFEGLKVVLPAPTGSTTEAMAEAKQALHAAVAVTHSMFAAAGREVELASISGTKIGIFQRDAAGNEQRLQEGITTELARDGDRFTLTVAREGVPAKAVLVATGVTADAEPTRPIRIQTQPFSIATLSALMGQALPGFSPEMQLVAEGVIEGRKTETRLVARNGVIDRPEWGLPHFVFNEIALDLAIPEPGKGIVVNRLAINAPEARLVASGLVKADETGGIDLTLKASEAVPGRLTPKDEPVTLSRLDLDARISRDGRTFLVRGLAFADGAATGRLEGEFSSANGGKIYTKLDAQGFDARRALRLWPLSIAPELRAWLVQHVEAGKLTTLAYQSLLEGQALADAFAQKPLPDDSMLVEYRMDDVRIRPIQDAPPIQKGVIRGRDTGRKAFLTLESGEIEAAPGQFVSLPGAEFRIDDVSVTPATMQMRLPFSGRVDAIIAVMATPTLRRIANPPTDLAIQDGMAEGVAEGWFRLVDKPGPRDARVDARAEIKGLRIDPVAKGEKLEGANLQFLSRNGTTTLQGEGRINGVPAQIAWRLEPGKDAEGTVRMVLDDAQRARRGMDLRPVLTGPTPVSVSITLPQRGPPDIDVELDLSRAKVEGIVPGFLKRPGQAAKVSFDLSTRDNRQVLDAFELDLGSVSARGRVELGADGQFQKAELASLKLSPGDNARGTFERQRNGMKVSIRGNSFDLRPFLRGFQSGRIDDQRGTDLDLDIQTTVLIGFNSELLANADVQAQRRSGNLTRIQARGRFGAAPLTVDSTPQGADGVLLTINSGDAGALVRFMDLYSRAYGGRLAAEIIVGQNSQRGLVQAWDFSIRGEQFLRQYAGGASGGSGPMSQGTNAQRGDSISFQKMRAGFNRRPGRIDFSEAVMWGQQVGGNIEGYLDYGGDRVDLKGVLVPAYALNNLFAQVPLLGPIFGGSQYEGLFALPFVITGRASQPVLRTNALSVIAPGFLRKMFELQREDGQGGRRSSVPTTRESPAR